MTTNKTAWLAALAASLFAGTASYTNAWDFRGIPLDQGGNQLASPTLDRMLDTGSPYFIDVSDDFDRNGPLTGSEVSGWQVGFVPPAAGVPDGYLTGSDAEAHGRWMSAHDGEYVVTAEQGGRVRRDTGVGISVICLPWVVEQGLGDYYHIEMGANVAVGESVQLAYFGDINQFGAAQGLAGPLGQLVLGLERGSGPESEQLTWTISWDLNGNRQHVSATFTRDVAVGDEVRMQLGWLDSAGDDLFDAWLETPDGSNTRLAEGNMATTIEVFGVGFEFSGIGSYGTNFAAAVPEPAAARLLICGIVGFATVIRRRGYRDHRRRTSLVERS